MEEPEPGLAPLDPLEGQAGDGPEDGVSVAIFEEASTDASFESTPHRFWRRAVALAMGVTSVFASAPASSGDSSRIEGSDRYGTAVGVSQRFSNMEQPSRSVVIASGEKFADALASAPLAAISEAPVLLTTRDTVPDQTRSELQRLQPDRIVVVGGQQAISQQAASSLESVAPVVRVAGADRYETAVALSQAWQPGVTDVFIASGNSYADALTGAAAAGEAKVPILLVDRNGLPASVAQELRRLGPQRISVLGGTAAISDAVAAQLRDFTQDVQRLAGNNRYETAVAVSQARSLPAPNFVFLATGENFPDALSAAAQAGPEDATLLLTRPTCLPDVVQAELDRLGRPNVVVLGGQLAVSQAAASGAACPVPPKPSGELYAVGGTTPSDTFQLLRIPLPLGSGPPEQALPPKPRCLDVALLPDGSFAAACYDRPNLSEGAEGILFLAITDGQGRYEDIPGSYGDETNPNLSPDGSLLVYNVYGPHGTLYPRIELYDMAAHTRRVLVDYGEPQLYEPRFSPSGRQIIFRNGVGQTQPGTVAPEAAWGIINTDGTGLRMLTKPIPGLGYGGVKSVDWLTEDRLVLVDGDGKLFTANLDGSGLAPGPQVSCKLEAIDVDPTNGMITMQSNTSTECRTKIGTVFPDGSQLSYLDLGRDVSDPVFPH